MRRQLSHLFLRRWRRIAVTLIPLVFALLHISDVLHLQVLERLDNIIYDTRLRVTMPRTLDERIQQLAANPDDELESKRLKKRKLQLKDCIARLESLLIPDQPA